LLTSALNARNWNAKDRLKMLNWLFLSRKDHWDVILLAQDFEMIDAQVRTPFATILFNPRVQIVKKCRIYQAP